MQEVSEKITGKIYIPQLAHSMMLLQFPVFDDLSL